MKQKTVFSKFLVTFTLVFLFSFSNLSGAYLVGQKINIAPAVLPEKPQIPDDLYKVTDFGANPNDGVDDTEAIQRAINTVSAKGGGRIIFPDGVYNISIQGEANAKSYNSAIIIYPKIALEAENSRKAIVRLGNNQPNYGAVFSWKQVGNADDVRIKGLVIDANSMNNKPITYDDFKYIVDGKVLRWLPRIVLMSRNGKRVEIDDVHFTNLLNINTINIGVPTGSTGENLEKTTDISITNCLFDNLGWQEYDFDHSTIFTQANRYLLKGNTFKSINGAGTLSARCAVETHGSDQTVVNNEIVGFTIGINATGCGLVSHRQLIENNKLLDVARGVYFWSFKLDAYPNAVMLKDVVVRRNFIRISPDAWQASAVPSRRHLGGITSNPENSSPVENVLIEHNNITTSGYGSSIKSYITKTIDNGIAFNNTDFKNVYILNNAIGRNLGPSIGGNGNVDGLVIKNNKFFEPEMAVTSELQNRAAINLTGKITNCVITNNTFKDIEVPNHLQYGIIISNQGDKNLKISDNVVEPSSIKLLK